MKQMAHKRIPKLYLLLAFLLLLGDCSSASFPADSRPQSASTSGDKVFAPASDASTDTSLLDEETFIHASQTVVEDFLSGNQSPYRLGLFDVNEDGTPEVMVQDYAGWASGCILYDLTDPGLAVMTSRTALRSGSSTRHTTSRLAVEIASPA